MATILATIVTTIVVSFFPEFESAQGAIIEAVAVLAAFAITGFTATDIAETIVPAIIKFFIDVRDDENDEEAEE